MVIMSEREKAHRLVMLRGLEGLMELGGFIQEEIEAEIRAVYPDLVVTKVEKYCPPGPGFWEVADATTRVNGKLQKYERKDEIFGEETMEFHEWVIDQVARIVTENVRKGKRSFWRDWKVPERDKLTLQNLNALDERILVLSSGIEGEDKLTAEEISRLPEFSCSEEYIQRVLDTIDRILHHGDWGNCNFEKICDENRSR